MKQHAIHKEMIIQVSERLGPLRPKVVFLGGSATGFHITDKAEPEIRATKDVDIIVEVASRVDYHQLEKTLRELGFFQKMQKDLRLAKDRLKKFDRNKQVVIQKNDSVTLGTIKKAAHFLGKRVTLQLV